MTALADKPIEDLYQQIIAQATIPAATALEDGTSRYLLRGLVVSLDEIMHHVTTSEKRYSQVQVYADIIRISADPQPVLIEGFALLLVARQIDIAGTRTVLIGEDNGLVVYTQGITGALDFKHSANPHASGWTLSEMPVDHVGLDIYGEENQIKHDPIKTMKNDMLRWLRPTRLLLTTQFQLAAALFVSHPVETQALLHWIIYLTQGATEARDLHRQSEALLTRSLLVPSTAVFVPYLSLQSYEREAHALFAPVKAYEAEYTRFVDKNASLAERQAAVRLLIQHNEATIRAHESLIVLAQQALAQAVTNAESARKKYEDQQYQVKIAKIDFEAGMQIWQSHQYWSGVRRMFLAVTDFALSVGSAVASGGASTGEAIANGSQALQALIALVGELDEIVKQIQVVLASMEHLDKMIADLEELIESLLERTQGKPEAELPWPEPTTPNLDLISGQAEWDIFMATTVALLQVAIDERIGGAAAYKLELDKQAIYGKAFLASQAAVFKACQELLQLQIQAQVSQSQQAPLQEYLQELTDNEELNTAVLQLLFQQQLNLKCWLFLAMQNLVWAFQYETLTDAEMVPSITTPILQLEEDLATLVRKLNNVRESLNPPPQSVQTTLLITTSEPAHSAYDGIIAALRDKREATIPLTVDEHAFRGLERVRVKRLRCVLQGVRIPPGRRISLTLENSGVQMDRWQEQTYPFVAAPSRRKFVYEHDHADATLKIKDELLDITYAITVDGEVAEEQRTSYYRPTPFSQWTITSDDVEQVIDFSTLQSLRLAWLVDAVVANPTARREAIMTETGRQIKLFPDHDLIFNDDGTFALQREEFLAIQAAVEVGSRLPTRDREMIVSCFDVTFEDLEDRDTYLEYALYVMVFNPLCYSFRFIVNPCRQFQTQIMPDYLALAENLIEFSAFADQQYAEISRLAPTIVQMEGEIRRPSLEQLRHLLQLMSDRVEICLRQAEEVDSETAQFVRDMETGKQDVTQTRQEYDFHFPQTGYMRGLATRGSRLQDEIIRFNIGYQKAANQTLTKAHYSLKKAFGLLGRDNQRNSEEQRLTQEMILLMQDIRSLSKFDQAKVLADMAHRRVHFWITSATSNITAVMPALQKMRAIWFNLHDDITHLQTLLEESADEEIVRLVDANVREALVRWRQLAEQARQYLAIATIEVDG